MFLLFQAIVFIVALQTIVALQCYSSMPGVEQPVIIDSANYTNVCASTAVCNCVSLQTVCMDLKYCTAAEVANNVTILYYGLIDQRACTGYEVPSVSNVTCCATDLCNNQGLIAQPGTSTPSRLTSTQYTSTTSRYPSNATTVSLSLSTSTSSSLSASILLVLSFVLWFI